MPTKDTSTTNDRDRERDRDSKDESKGGRPAKSDTKLAETPDLGNGMSPEGVVYQGPSRPREEMERKGENTNPERAQIEQKIADLQDQLDRDAAGLTPAPDPNKALEDDPVKSSSTGA